MKRCSRNSERGWMALECHVYIHPRTQRKEVPGIENECRQAIGSVIENRLSRARLRAGYRDLLIRIAGLALIAILVFSFGFLITQHHGQGMAPAMKDGDLCIVFRRQAQSLMGLKWETGDVVAYKTEEGRHFGRVAAIGGDTIQLSAEGYLSVNGGASIGRITADRVQAGPEYPITVPQGSVYVLCDDNAGAPDSRDLGPIPYDRVEGKVITILRRRGI